MVMFFPSLPVSMRKTTLCYGFRTRTVPNGHWWKCWCIREKYGNRGSIPFFIQNVNDTNGANWVYISDWRHSCHFHSHISTLPIFQCDCQQEPVVHLPYRLRNRGSHSFYLAALHHNPLSRLPYRPHNQLYLSRHIGTAAQATAHLLQLLPEVRIIVNPILQLTVSHLRIQIREITQGQFSAAIRAYLKNGREERMFFQQ